MVESSGLPFLGAGTVKIPPSFLRARERRERSFYLQANENKNICNNNNVKKNNNNYKIKIFRNIYMKTQAKTVTTIHIQSMVWYVQSKTLSFMVKTK